MNIYAKIMRFTCCLNMGFNSTKLKMSSKLFVLNYMEWFVAQTDHFADAFVHIKTLHAGMMF